MTTRLKSDVSTADRNHVLAARACRYCGDLLGPFEVDHIRPLSRGGDNHRDNLASACVSCNTQKSNMLLHEWQQWRTSNGMIWPPTASHPTQPAHYADCCGTCRDTTGELPAVTVPHRLAPDEGASYWAYYRCQTCQTTWRTWWSANIGYYSDCTCAYCAMCRLEGAE